MSILCTDVLYLSRRWQCFDHALSTTLKTWVLNGFMTHSYTNAVVSVHKHNSSILTWMNKWIVRPIKIGADMWHQRKPEIGNVRLVDDLSQATAANKRRRGRGCKFRSNWKFSPLLCSSNSLCSIFICGLSTISGTELISYRMHLLWIDIWLDEAA